MAAELKVDTDHFWKKGYTIVRDVFTKAEIEKFRIDSFASVDHGGDLLSNPKLRSIITDGRLLECAKQILKTDEILYYADSAFTIRPGNIGWHKDNADREDANAPDWKSPYTQLRFGIYCQDHYTHSDGLNLRAGSHNEPDLEKGKNVYVRSRVGDLGIWSMRISHSGGGMMLKFPRWHSPEPLKLDKYPKWLIAPKPEEARVAIFAALGADDEHAARYIEYLKTRTYMVKNLRRSIWDEEAMMEAKNAGLKLRDVPREVEHDDTVGKNAAWAPLPY
jgi:hypothetical protein